VGHESKVTDENQAVLIAVLLRQWSLLLAFEHPQGEIVAAGRVADEISDGLKQVIDHRLGIFCA
jgi:hypothetical protein